MAGVEQLEARALLAALNPLELSTLDGTSGFRLDGVQSGDYSGFRVSGAGDVNGDGFDDLIVGAIRADVGGQQNAGESYVVFGKAGGFAAGFGLATLDGTNGFRLPGVLGSDEAGWSVSSAGDFNGDGIDDLFMGAAAASPNGLTNAGESYVVFGRRTPFPASFDLASLNGANGFRLAGDAAFGYSGRELNSAGDVNGDGFDDLILGAPGSLFSGGNTHVGEAFVVFGRASMPNGRFDLSSLNGANGFRLTGLTAGDRFGSSASSAGDINGDGLDDVIVGAYRATTNGNQLSGEAYVVFGNAGTFPANLSPSALDGTNGFRLPGLAFNQRLGFPVDSAGDVNGDGFDDLILADVYGGGGGRGFVVFGKANGFSGSVNLATLDGTNGFRVEGTSPGGNAGIVVSSAGDVNGDGFDDLLISDDGASPNSVSGAGTSYIIFGMANGFPTSIDLTTMNNVTGFALNGINAGDTSGIWVNSAGDLNGDGFDDFVINAAHADPNNQSAAGETYVIFGRNFTGAVTHAGSSAGETLTGTTAVNVMIGGQGDDVLIGKGGADVLRGGQGNDVLAIADLTFQRVAGGNGSDTLWLDGSGLLLNLATFADHKLTSIETIDLRGRGSNQLTLAARDVLNLTAGSNPASTANTLRVRRGTDDTVSMGTGWTTAGSQTIGGVTYDLFTQGAAKLLVERAVAGPLWQNPGNHSDVNGDDAVTSQDALIVINEINDRQISAADGKLPLSLPPGYGPPYYDVDGDGFVVATDAIIVINQVNAAAGEGESGELFGVSILEFTPSISIVSAIPISLTPLAVESQHMPTAATAFNRSAAAVTRDAATRAAVTDAVFGMLHDGDPFDEMYDPTRIDFDFWHPLAKR